MISILPITKARESLTDLVDKTSRLFQEFVITVNGKPAAILISIEEYESLKETADILSDKDLVKQLLKAETEISNNNYISLNEFRKELKV